MLTKSELRFPLKLLATGNGGKMVDEIQATIRFVDQVSTSEERY